MRGEHCFPDWSRPENQGSSPHARGAPTTSAAIFSPRGIIPACAGSTRARRPAGHVRGDHPRMRGEHSLIFIVFLLCGGSSPHARGALVACAVALAVCGIIPACAGSTTTRWDASRASRDHPRMRGEHASWQTASTARWGSSPHARGALRRRSPRPASSGIIPACAGSTAPCSRT